MAGAEKQRNLFAEPLETTGTIVVNDRCLIRTEHGIRVVIVSSFPVTHYAVDDGMAEAYAMVSLVEQGWANQKDVARAFGCSVRSVRRHQSRFSNGGLAALGRARGYPSGRPRLMHSRQQMVRRLKAQGLANREVARRLGVTPKAVRKLLKRIGWHDQRPEQIRLPSDIFDGDPKLSSFSPAPAADVPGKAFPPGDPKLSAPVSANDEPIPPSFDSDPSDRRVDRILAYMGLLVTHSLPHSCSLKACGSLRMRNSLPRNRLLVRFNAAADKLSSN